MTSVAFKRVRRKTLLKRLTQALGPNRTLRTFRAGHRLLAAGVATARPLAVIVPSRWDLAAPSWIVTEWLDGARDLAQFSPRTSGEASAAAAAVGKLLGRMHAAGWAHRDLKPQNLLVRFTTGNDEAQAFVIDLDGARFVRRVPERIRWKNLARMLDARDGWLADSDIQERILQSYLESGGPSIDSVRARSLVSQAVAARRAA
jgi:tRNA A-37 threonylcarbamoyl transferase component Bud32